MPLGASSSGFASHLLHCNYVALEHVPRPYTAGFRGDAAPVRDAGSSEEGFDLSKGCSWNIQVPLCEGPRPQNGPVCSQTAWPYR